MTPRHIAMSVANLWAKGFGILGIVMGVRLALFERAPWSLMLLLAAGGAIYGALAGLVFGVALLVLARWRVPDRVASVALIACSAAGAFWFGRSMVPGYATALLFAACGAACAAASLRNARAPAS